MKLKDNIDLQKAHQDIKNILLEQQACVDNKTPPPISFTPYFIESKRYNYLSDLCVNIHAAIEKLLKLYIEDSDTQRVFPELKNYKKLLCLTPNYDTWIHMARFDIAETSSGDFKLLETNCDCPGGVIFNPTIKIACEQMNLFDNQAMLKFLKQPIDDRFIFFKSMIDSYKEVKGYNPQNFALVTSKYRPIENEINLMVKVAKELGLSCVHAKAQDFYLENNQLCVNGKVIDIVYQKIDAYVNKKTNMLKYCLYNKSESEVKVYLDSIFDKKITYFNSFQSIFIGENKRILALLKDPQYKSLFSKNELEAIEKFCPKTFYLSEIDKDCQNKSDEIMLNKDKYVIKSVLDTRGRGVYIGKNISSKIWKNLVSSIKDRAYIIQEYIDNVKTKVLSPYTFEEEPMYTTLAMFILKGKPSGLFVRSSKDEITNVVGKAGCLRLSYVIK